MSVPNLTIRSGVQLNDAQARFVVALAERVGSQVPVVVTSGLRSIQSQASIIKQKAESQGWDVIYGTYGSQGAAYKAAYPDLAKMAQVAASGAGAGTHLGGGAVDLSSNMSSDQLKTLMKAALDLGASVLWEKPGGGVAPVYGVKVANISPEHLHVGNIPGTLLPYFPVWAYWAWAGAALTIAGTIAVLILRRR